MELTLMDGTTIPEDLVLGAIALFTVPDEQVDAAKLNRQWASEGLDPGLIPQTRKPSDVFSKACRSVETRRSTSGGHRAEVKVDEVSDGPDERIYQITRLVRDQTNQVIDHPKAMTLILDKHMAEGIATNGYAAADVIKVKPRDPATFGALKGLADVVLANFDEWLKKVPGEKVRNAVRDSIIMLGGENLRRKSGGVYFVPASGFDTLESLSRVLDAMYGGDADLHIIPQPKTDAVQEMISKHHTLNVVKECDEMIARITERLKTSGKVRRDLLTNLIQQRRELGARRRMYADLLGEESKKLTGHFSLLDDQIERLMEAAS